MPQQVGDFAVLVHSGFARSRAFAYNVAVGVATLAGALAGYFALADMQQALPTVLAVAASSLLYVAVADLIPSLHRRPEPLETAKQLLLIGLGDRASSRSRTSGSSVDLAPTAHSATASRTRPAR